MDLQVKERIVGAIVLIALGVWLIPWVLDGAGEADPAAEPVAALSLPAADESAPIRTETVELEPRPAAAASGAGTERAAANPASEPAAGADGGTLSGGSQSGGSQRADSQPGEALAGNLPPEAVSEPAPAAADAGTSTAAEPPLAAAGESAAVEQPAPEGWSVQVGSFSEMAMARQQASRVSDYGYPARVTEFHSGQQTLHRVRVYGFESREQAEVVKSSLSAHGFVARVFPPE